MYIHIGEDLNVRLRDIIAIFDKQSMNSPLFEEFLKKHEGKIIDFAKGSFHSIVVTNDKMYLTPLASKTLKKRADLTNI